MKIEVIQIKRGNRSALITFLSGDNKPKEGEPIFEMDTKKLKIGDGIHNYEDLDYVAGGGIEIEDALDGQILIYNETTDQWEAKALADGQSIEYGEDGLRIAGFTGEASQNGLFPMANNGGLSWQRTLDQTALNNAISTAQAQADRAAQEATNARGAATAAATNEANTAAMVEQTAALYGSKFWYGTFAEYQSDVINAGKLNEGTIYFISDNPNN